MATRLARECNRQNRTVATGLSSEYKECRRVSDNENNYKECRRVSDNKNNYLNSMLAADVVCTRSSWLRLPFKLLIVRNSLCSVCDFQIFLE